MAVARRWTLVLTSSAEQENIEATDIVSQDYLRTWRSAADATLERLKAERGTLNKGGFDGLHSIINQAWKRHPVEVIDLATSQCSDPTDTNHHRCFYQMVKAMQGEWVHRGTPPDKLITAQSKYQGTITRAADYASRKSNVELTLDTYLNELLPDVDSHFFKPLQLLAESPYKASARRIRLHVVRPLTGTVEDIARVAGLSKSQLMLEEYLPVSEAFMGRMLPHPGEAIDVDIQPRVPQDEAHLEAKRRASKATHAPVHISVEDTLTLVAFGPSPNPGTVNNYAEQLMKSGPLKRKNVKGTTRGLSWVFFDTGDSKAEGHAELHETLSNMAEAFNLRQEETGGRVRLAPFEHQLETLRKVKGRSDLIITTAASDAAGELLALARRGDVRHILIDVGGTEGLGSNARMGLSKMDWWERESWEQLAFRSMKQTELWNYRYLAKRLDATLTTEDTFADAWEDAGMRVGGYCPESGSCDTQLWDGPSVCGSSLAKCGEVVEAVMSSSRSWYLLLTSSGGGGHLSAANALSKTRERGWRANITTAASQLDATRALMSERGYEGLKQMITRVQKAAHPVVVVDLMSSPCTNLLGEHGLSMGKTFSDVWNYGQARGAVKALTTMVKAQSIEDDLFHSQCKKYIYNLLRATNVPAAVLSCQPMQHAAITSAIHDVAQQANITMHLDIYMTELPSNTSISFYDPLHALSIKDPDAASHVRFHTVAPMEGGTEIMAARTGLGVSQIAIEENLPVEEALCSGSLPGPGSAMTIALQAGSQREEKFLRGRKKQFRIAAEDTVTLVMLGSQPTVSFMHQYRQQLMTLGPPRWLPNKTGLNWIFLATGSAKQEPFDKLYSISADEAEEFNFLQRLSDGRTRIVPFTKQSVLELEGRADVTLTRSGGITSGELLALSKQGKERRCLLHLEVNKDLEGSEPDITGAMRLEWEHQALSEGMLPWEMGNALYLQKALNATLVTPKTLTSIW
mmetsp:Transcript_49475/g.158304  ORF Transcript_49475/g.158304 Transcript_49475/m.158304 type:complete len:973 (+) Transcript_49475:1-2919(+)